MISSTVENSYTSIIMTKTVQYSVFRGSPSGDVISEEIRKTIGPNEVFLEISHAGLCGTDRFFKDRKIVLGHEGAGKVRDVGSMVTYFKPGDRVGFGWVQKVCGTCDWCITGKSGLGKCSNSSAVRAAVTQIC